MKTRILCFVLSLAMILSLASCGSGSAGGEIYTNPSNDNEVVSDEQDTSFNEQPSHSDKTQETEETSTEDPRKVSMLSYLKELLKDYSLNPYSFIPEAMLPTFSQRIVASESISKDYTSPIQTNLFKGMGMGEQWKTVSDNLSQSQIFFNALSIIDGLTTTSVVVFNNYLDKNPADTAHYVFSEGIYSVTIHCDSDTIYYVIEYTADFPALGTQSAQIALYMDIESKVKTVRIQLGDANALSYTIGEDYYAMAIKYLGVRRAFFSIEKSGNDYIEGHIYEYLVAGSVEISSAADFYLSDGYMTVIGNKADGMLGFDGYICELYNAETGEMIAYEVQESAGDNLVYNTIWFDLSKVEGINSIMHVPASKDRKEQFYVNGSSTAWEAKLVGLSGGWKLASRRFDIEFRTQYYFYYDTTDETYKAATSKVPMLFVQQEYYNDVVKDINSTNGITVTISVSEKDLSALINNYETLIPIFINNKSLVTPAKIVDVIGNKITFD